MNSGVFPQWLSSVAAALVSAVMTMGADAQVLGAGPLRQLWREDLVNVGNALQYEATAVVLDAEDNLFVGGSVRLNRPYPQQFPFIARFDRNGTRLWEFWPPNNVVDQLTVDGMASNGRQGVYAALRLAGGGVQLAYINSQGHYDHDLERLTNCWINQGPRPAVNSVHLSPDGQNGFYFLSLLPQGTNSSRGEFTLTRYAEGGQKLWSTNVFRGGFWGWAGLERALVVTSNSVYFCGLRLGENPFQVDSQLVKVGTDGAVHWVNSSRPNAQWLQLAALDDETVCVSGGRNFEVWSAAGTCLASHGAWGFNSVARQSADASGFLVSDFNSSNLVGLDRAGRMRKLGQIPATTMAMGAVELLNITPDTWLVAANCREGWSSTTNNLSLFEFGQNGELKWRQRLPGFEYPTHNEGQPGIVYHWLLKASDGSVRLVVNLNNAPANRHMGIAVAAFSLTNEYSAPRLISTSPVCTNVGPEGVQLAVEATGNGPLRFEWHHLGYPASDESTNGNMLVGYPGVYCVRIIDDTGESVSPAFNVLPGEQLMSIGLSESSPTVAYAPGYGIEFHLETSTNLTTWSSAPTVYSSMADFPTSALDPFPGTPGARFFRARLLPASH